jgi:hypothetical protein
VYSHFINHLVVIHLRVTVIRIIFLLLKIIMKIILFDCLIYYYDALIIYRIGVFNRFAYIYGLKYSYLYLIIIYKILKNKDNTL